MLLKLGNIEMAFFITYPKLYSVRSLHISNIYKTVIIRKLTMFIKIQRDLTKQIVKYGLHHRVNHRSTQGNTVSILPVIKYNYRDVHHLC